MLTSPYQNYSIKILIKIAAVAIVMLWIKSACLAQNEYLCTLDYHNLAINRLANIAGVTYITGNSTVDEKSNRYFFQGAPTTSGPFSVYTLDGATGNILSQALCPSAGMVGNIVGLQYDQIAGKLYAVFLNSSQASFVSINPATGAINILAALGGYMGYAESCFDSKDHIYIINGSGNIEGIDANTGNMLFNWTGISLANIAFDNTTDLLYGIHIGVNPASLEFCSVVPSSGLLSNIAALPLMGLPQLNASVVDENAGGYVFVGSYTTSSGCTTDSLYSVNIMTGNFQSRVLFPYDKGINVYNDENFLNFCFNNGNHTLYALNWDPPAASTKATISASINPACEGAEVDFSATADPAFTSPFYQWQVNGINTGSNDSQYTSSTLSSSDIIGCIITEMDACATGPSDTSNAITMTIIPVPTASMTVFASANSICSGDTVYFTSTSANAGSAPDYQWQINGVAAGTGGPDYSTSSLNNGDIVSCIFQSSLTCALPVESTNSIPITVNPTPAVHFSPDTLVIKPGGSVTLTPSLSGSIADYLWTPSTGLNNPAIAEPVAQPIKSGSYQLTISSTNGCQASAKLELQVYYVLNMPNAFSPDGNGLNDLFRIPPSSPQQIQSFFVFNRWGQMVFHTTNSGIGWNGNSNGQPQPAGTYIWEIRYADLLSGKSTLAKGTVVLIR